jgi:hypothetical protein
MPEQERPLTGGRVTPGVVRVGETVRRPLRANSEFVRRLLEHLAATAFEGAPRYLGVDDAGREVFGFTRASCQTSSTRRFRTTRSRRPLCHGDLSPCNFVFDEGKPVAIIDFDAAAPGYRLGDLGYALFLWLNLGTDGPPPDEQARRLRLFCDAYGCEAEPRIVQAVVDAVAETIDRLGAADLRWWQVQRRWLEENGDVLVAPAPSVDG